MLFQGRVSTLFLVKKKCFFSFFLSFLAARLFLSRHKYIGVWRYLDKCSLASLCSNSSLMELYVVDMSQMHQEKITCWNLSSSLAESFLILQLDGPLTC